MHEALPEAASAAAPNSERPHSQRPHSQAPHSQGPHSQGPHSQGPRGRRRAPPWRLGLGVFAVAVAAAAFAITFRAALSHSLRWLAGAKDVVSALRSLPVHWRLLLPALGGLCAGLIAIPTSRFEAQGVGNVMEAVALGRVRLSTRVTLLKSLASFFAIVSGGSLGREGPLIQFGGATGKLVSRWLDMPNASTRVLIAAGTAAGFAAAYNTPLSAILFVLEVLTGVVVLDAILPTLAATVLATVLTRSVVGAGPIYGERVFFLRSPSELFAFAGLGLVTAVGAQLFMRGLAFAERLFRALPGPRFIKPALGGLLAGGWVAFLPEVAGNGYEPLNTLLDARLPIGFVALLLLGKAFATTASVGSGSPGGVFTPTLMIGGALGILFEAAMRGIGFDQLGPAGGYALVGMAAATAATTHAPLMSAVMVFELSGDYAIVLPLMLSTASATWVSKRLRKDSIYGAELRQRGISLGELTLEGRRKPQSLPP